MEVSLEYSIRSTVDTALGACPPPKYPKSVPCGAGRLKELNDTGTSKLPGPLSGIAFALELAAPILYLASLSGPFADAVAVSLE